MKGVRVPRPQFISVQRRDPSRRVGSRLGAPHEAGLDEAAGDDADDLEAIALPAAPDTSESQPREPLLPGGLSAPTQSADRGSQPPAVVGHRGEALEPMLLEAAATPLKWPHPE